MLTHAVLALLWCAQDDKAAAELLKKVAERAAAAKTLHVKVGVSGDFGDMSIEARLKGPAMIAARCAADGRDVVEVKSDGTRLVVTGVRRGPREWPRPGEVSSALRRCGVGDVLWTPFLMFDEAGGPEPWRQAPAPEQVQWEGTEKVAGADASIVRYRLRIVASELSVRIWIDPSKLAVLKRELSLDGGTVAETYDAFAYDVEMADDEFALQSAATLKAGRTGQVARSVELFMRYTGQVPRALGDLATRPEWLDKDVFWPGGGFWLGAAVPDVAYAVDGLTAKVGDRTLGPADRRAIVAAGDRLAKHYTARVRIALVASGAEAFRTTYAALPRRKADLWQRPEWATVWPEGGFVARAPGDPWGAPLRIITDVHDVRIQVADWRDRAIKTTDDERKALTAGAGARLSAAETKEIGALIEQLRDDDLETREKASARLVAWGPAVSELLDRRVTTERDAETLARFREMRERLRPASPAWNVELGALMMHVRGDGKKGAAVAEECANQLSQLWKMQMNYMAIFGGRAKLMPSKTGVDFWLELSRTAPPIIDPSATDIFVCPGGAEREGCTYWGPAENVNTYADGDPVGMCDDPCHGGDAIILRKSGEAMTVTQTDPLYAAATVKLKGPKGK